MDIFKFNRKKVIFAALIAAHCCLLMVIFPTIALCSARKGISLWVSNVLPALLPFFICSNFLQNIGIIKYLRSGAFPFTMSVLSGYPMGAKIVGDLKRGGEISLTEAKRLMSFCSTSGPAFMIGAVGAGMLGSGFLGGIVAVSHYLGAVANGIVYTYILGRDKGYSSGDRLERSYGIGIQELFTEAILSSFKSLGIILAYIVMFTFVTDIIHMSGGFSIVESQEARALIKGFLEMTVGCGAVAECMGAADSVKCVLCTAIMSWGGLSVLGQSMSMLSGSGISVKYLFVSKLTHSLFASVIAFIITVLVL